MEYNDIGVDSEIDFLKGDTGEKGDKGEQGIKGDKGDKGDTPIRGIDYWTQEDITAIETYCQEYIDSHINNAIGGEY